MRIQFWGDLAGTGFGTVTMALGKELLRAGHEVRFISQNDLGHDLPEPFASLTFRVTPELVDQELAAVYGDTPETAGWGSLTPVAILKLIRGELWQDGWRPDAAFILGDYVNVQRMVMADEHTAAAFTALPTYHYCPIEGVDLPPSWLLLWKILRPIAMCEAGATEIEKIVGYRPPVIYHGVDSEMFRPVSPDRPLYLEMADRTTKLRSKTECKKFLGLHPTDRILLRTDRFMPRKRYGSMLRALAPVLAERPDVQLIMHCRQQDEGGNMLSLRSKYPGEIQTRMNLTGFFEKYGGVDPEILTVLYNAADVYVSTSAEGFGLTIAEAMACGTPVVGMDYSSVPEVVGPGGLLAPVNRLDDNEYDYAWATVDERVFGKMVGELLDNELKRRSLGRAAVEHIRTMFTWAGAARQLGDVMDREAVAA